MIPMTRTSAPTRSLVEYWNEARLRVSAAKSSSVRPAPGIVPWRTAIEDVLKVGYGIQTQPRFLAGAWQEVRWRTTPSAGALYPFEVIATIVGEGSYLWDVEKGHLVPYDAPVLQRDDLAAAGFVTRPRQRVEALLTFVARPFQSMKKYFLRGYTYCHLDVGHTATNLALYTAALGHDPIVHLRFSRQFLVEHLKLDGLCREPLAVLSFATAEAAADAAEDAAPGAEVQSRPVGLELPGEREIRSWDSLQGLLSFDSALQPPGPPAGTALLQREPAAAVESLLPFPDAHPPLSAAGAWRSAILGRRSAKGFRAEPVTLAQVGDLLGALRGEGLTADCSLESAVQLGVRLVARNVEDLTGIYSYVPAGHALHRIDAAAGDPRPACMQQGLAGNAAALLIFHAPIGRLFRQSGYSAFAELHFRAAEAAQRIHLVATRLGALGVTCIGGFDGEECAALARLDDGEEAVYVILVGISDDSVFKYDRLNVAFSHGHTSTLED